MKQQQYNISYFMCPECSNVLPLPRKKAKRRNKGHTKHLYCVFCRKVVETTEIRHGDMYVRDNGNVIYC